jgi:site-specific recombinase XerD
MRHGQPAALMITLYRTRSATAWRLLVDIRIMQMLLGHARIRSTEIYTQLSAPMRANLGQLLGDCFAHLF